MFPRAFAVSCRSALLVKVCHAHARTFNVPRSNFTAGRFIHASRPVLATPPPMVKESSISTERYHELSDTTMDTLLESLETLLDKVGNTAYEVEYSSGVLTLNLADKGTYVINKQPPNKQIWLSSPFSGPVRYDYVPEKDGWYYSRDGHSLETLLDEELSKVFGRQVRLGVGDVSSKVA